MKTAPKIVINLNLLKPQNEPQKIVAQALHWLLSAGRYIIVFVEIIVLVAFLARFKFDGDIADTKEAINNQVPFLKSLKSDEQLIRRLQSQTTSIRDLKKNSPDYPAILDIVASQTPLGVILNSLTFEKTVGKSSLKIIGSAQNHNDLAAFVEGLKNSPNFSDVGLSSIGLEEGVLIFSVDGSVKTQSIGDKKL